MVWQIDLSGKCIVVTGGNRGIGLAISHQCAQAGAHVAIIYRSSKDAPEIAKQIAEKYDVRCVAYQCDVGEQDKITELFKEIYHDVGPVGGVVCNAGLSVQKPAIDFTKEDFDAQFTPNVWGVFTCAQAAARLWKEHDYKNGRVVFISSMSARIANMGVEQSFYNASKGALNMLAKCLAMEWADQGILVNCISPGFVEYVPRLLSSPPGCGPLIHFLSTDMNQSLRDDPKLKAEVEKRTMLSRISDPSEQAGGVVFFLSDQASYVTGQELVIDGGKTSW